MNTPFCASHDAALICAIEQFYYLEADLLDERQYLQWLSLWREDGIYRMPNRFVMQADTADRGSEHIHRIEREISQYGANDLPLREENFFQLALRADRALKHNAWAENPPARCRRFIANVRAQPLSPPSFRVHSNFQLLYSRHTQPVVTYSGQRRDVLVQTADSFRIVAREVVLDCSLIMAPTVGLLF